MFETHSFHRKYLDLEFSLSACQFLWESVEEPIAKVDVLLRAYILQLKSEGIDIVHPPMVPLSYIHSKICSHYGHGFHATVCQAVSCVLPCLQRLLRPKLSLVFSGLYLKLVSRRLTFKIVEK